MLPSTIRPPPDPPGPPPSPSPDASVNQGIWIRNRNLDNIKWIRPTGLVAKSHAVPLHMTVRLLSYCPSSRRTDPGQTSSLRGDWNAELQPAWLRSSGCKEQEAAAFRMVVFQVEGVGGCSKARRSTPIATKRHGGAAIGAISLLLAVILALPFAAAPPPSPSPPPKRRLLNASKTNYTIGIPFDPLLTPVEYLAGGINPFAIFLNEHVGKQFEPRIYFKLEVLYFDRTTLESGLQAGIIDFFFASAVETLCVEERYKTSTIAQISRYDTMSIFYNQLQQFDGAELTGYGGLFVVRGDSDIQTVEDFKGKVMVSEPGLGSAGDGLGGCLLQLGVLQERGVSYTDDTVSVIWNGGGAGMTISLLLDGLADVGFLRTGILQLIVYLQQVLPEGHPIRKFADRVKPDTFRVVEGKMDQKWDGGWNGKFQRETSTPVAPEWSVNALQSVDTNVKQAFVEAIMDLRGFTDNTSTVEQPWLNPALAGAGYVYRFRSPLPLTDVRNLMESLGMFRVDPVTHDRGCKISDMSFRGVYDAISCPSGSFKRTLQQVMTGCRDEGFSCPALVGILGCTCHPCKQGDEFDVKMITHGTDPESLAGPVENEESGDVMSNRTIKICRKNMEPCIDSDSGQLIEVLVSDNSFSERGLVIEWVLRYSETRNDTGSLVRLHPGGFLYAVNITAQVPGEHIFKLLVNGQEIPNSPFTINVLPIKCDLREYFDRVEGKCACLPSHLRVALLNGECRHIVGFTLTLVAMGMTAIFFMTIIYMIRRISKIDRKWMIDKQEVQLPARDKRVVLGRGRSGDVFQSCYRGTPVAIKNLWAPSDFEDLDDGKSTRGKVNFPPTQSTTATAAAVENPSGTFFMAGSMDAGLYGEKPSARSRVLAAMCGGTLWVMAEKRRQIFNMYRDMRVVSKIRHPCILNVMGAVINDKVPKIVCEVMSAGSLQSIVFNHTVILESPLIWPILNSIANALEYLHFSSTPIVHGNFKTSNVMLDASLHAKVSDFAIFSNAAYSTPAYLSPERLVGEKASVQSDVYAFGVVLWEVFSRRVPLSAEMKQLRQPGNLLAGSRAVASHGNSREDVYTSGWRMSPSQSMSNGPNSSFTATVEPNTTDVISTEQAFTELPQQGQNVSTTGSKLFAKLTFDRRLDKSLRHQVFEDICDQSKPHVLVPDYSMPRCITTIMAKCLAKPKQERPNFKWICKELARQDPPPEFEVELKSDKTCLLPVPNSLITPMLESLPGRTREEVSGKYRELVSIMYIHISNVRSRTLLGSGSSPMSHKDRKPPSFGTAVSGADIASRARATVDLLHQKWAELAAENGVLPLDSKTDNFMAVSNVIEEQADQMSRLARMAVAACRIARDVLHDRQTSLVMKGGIHSGSVVTKLHGMETVGLSVFGDSLTMATNLALSSVNVFNRNCKFQLSERASIQLMQEMKASPRKSFQCTRTPSGTEVIPEEDDREPESQSTGESAQEAKSLMQPDDDVYHIVPRGSVKIKVLGRVRTFWLVNQPDVVDVKHESSNQPPLSGTKLHSVTEIESSYRKYRETISRNASTRRAGTDSMGNVGDLNKELSPPPTDSLRPEMNASKTIREGPEVSRSSSILTAASSAHKASVERQDSARSAHSATSSRGSSNGGKGFRNSRSFGSSYARGSSGIATRIKASDKASVGSEESSQNFGRTSPKSARSKGTGSASLHDAMMGSHSMIGSRAFGNSSQGKSLLSKLSKYLDPELLESSGGVLDMVSAAKTKSRQKSDSPQ